MKIVIYIFTFVFLLSSCKKKQPVILDPSAPCGGFQEVSADFLIEERYNVINGSSGYISSDISHHSSFIRFQALEENANYKWYIGSQQYNTKEVELFFDNTNAGSIISVTCVVQKNPNSYCFPQDDGYDSIVKTFKVSNLPIYTGDGGPSYFGVSGTYRVLNPSNNDSIDIGVRFANYQGLFECVLLTNFDGNGTVITDSTNQIQGMCYRKMNFKYGNSTNYSQRVYGTVLNELNGYSYLNFSSFIDNGPSQAPTEVNWNYKGRKIN